MENLGNAENAKSVLATEERPDFGRIVDSLQKEAANGLELVERLSHLVNTIKRIDSIPDAPSEQTEKNPQCLVDFLWAEIWKIQRTNKQLEKCVSHLLRTVGN